MRKTKKIAAALAAVEAYMREESDGARAVAPLPERDATSAGYSAWALAARMETMTDRRMMQLRAFAFSGAR